MSGETHETVHLKAITKKNKSKLLFFSYTSNKKTTTTTTVTKKKHTAHDLLHVSDIIALSWLRDTHTAERKKKKTSV